MDRREFTKATLLALASGAFGVSCSVPVPRKDYSSTASSRGYAYLGLIAGNASILRKLNLDNYEYEDINLPLLAPHAVTRAGDDLYVFDFQGSAVKVSANGKILKPEESRFYGHGFFSPHEEVLWCTEILSTGAQVVRARSTKDLRIIDGDGYAFPGGHHIARFPGTDLIASCGSDGRRHYVSFFDFKKRQLVKNFETKYPGVHLLPISESEFVAPTTEFEMGSDQLRSFVRMADPAQRSTMTEKEKQFAGFSPVMYANLKGETREYWDPAKRDHFQLGLGIDRVDGERILTSHYSSDSVILWKGPEIEKIYKVPGPLVIVATGDGKSFVAQSERGIKIYSLETGLLERELTYQFPVYTLARY